MPFVFCLLVAWYVVNWVEKAVVNSAARVTGRAAEKLAGTAERLGERGQNIRNRATATAEKLRSRPAATEPRTRAGQRLSEKTAHATGQALGGVIGWLRIMWADATAAAESAQARRAAGQGMWWQWPTGDDPQAPVQATAERLDQEDEQPSPDMTEPEPVDVVHDTPGQPQDPDMVAAGQKIAENMAYIQWISEETFKQRQRHPNRPIIKCRVCGEDTVAEADPCYLCQLRAEKAASVQDDDQHAGPVQATAERLDQDQPTEPDQLASGPLAITDGRNNTMETAAESGLGAYLAYSNSMAASCQNGVSSIEATIAALESQDWSGVPVDAMRKAQEALNTAAEAFTEAYGAFDAALSVREAYSANDHAGSKESVLAD